MAEMEASQVIIAGSIWLLDGALLVVSTERTTTASQKIRIYSGLDDASGAPTTETVELQRLQLVDGVPYKKLRLGSDGIPLMMEVVWRHLDLLLGAGATTLDELLSVLTSAVHAELVVDAPPLKKESVQSVITSLYPEHQLSFEQQGAFDRARRFRLIEHSISLLLTRPPASPLATVVPTPSTVPVPVPVHIPAPQAPPSTTKPAVSMPAAKAAAPTVSPGVEKRHKEQATNRPQHSAAATSANFKALSTFRVELPLEQCRRSLLFALTPVHPAYEMESDVTSVPGYFQVGFAEGELETRGLQSGDVLRQMHGVHTYNMSRRDLSDIVDAVPAAVGKVELLFTRDEGSRALAQLQTDVLQDPGMDCTLYKARVVSTLQFQGYIRKTSKAGAPPLPAATTKALPSSSSAPAAAAAAAAASLRPPTINTSLPKSKPPTSSSSSPRTAVLGQSEAAAAIAARKLNPPAPTTGKAKTMEKTKTQTKGVFGWERKARPVECSYKEAPTAVIHRWVSVGEAAKQLGVHKPAIYLSISRGRALRHRLVFRYSDAKDTAATTDELITLDELCAALKKDVHKSTKQGGGGDDSDGEDVSGDDDDEDGEEEEEEENGQEQEKSIHKSFAASSQRACPHCGELLSADNFQKRLRNHELHACKMYKGGQKGEEEERESESEAEMDFSKRGSKRRRDEPDAAPIDLLNFLAVGSEIEASQKANAPKVNWHRAKIVEMGTGDREGEAFVAWQVGGRGSWLPMTSEHMCFASEKRSRRG